MDVTYGNLLKLLTGQHQRLKNWVERPLNYFLWQYIDLHLPAITEKMEHSRLIALQKGSRVPSPNEIGLIAHLVSLSGITPPHDWKSVLTVKEMSDGGMGNLYLFLGNQLPNRTVAHLVGDCQFQDRDGVEVLASLFVDDDGVLLELDLCKVDFEPLIAIPDFPVAI